jgi:PilZ domain
MRLPLPMKRDRRRWKRHWFNGSVQVWSGARRIDGLGIQVSRGGMYLFAIAHLPVGSEIKVVFVAPGSGQRIEVYGAVRHRAVYLYGVEFQAEEQDAMSGARPGAMLNESNASR